MRVENGFRLNATQVLSQTSEKVARSVAQRSIHDVKKMTNSKSGG